jgi:hypothetical protein
LLVSTAGDVGEQAHQESLKGKMKDPLFGLPFDSSIGSYLLVSKA